MTDKLIPFVFKSTGVEVALAPVSNIAIMKLQRSYPRPTPPLEKVANADGTFRDEPNPDNPAYAGMIEEWNQFTEMKVREYCIKRGVIIHLNDEQKTEVANYRQFMKEHFPEDVLDDNDTYVFITEIAMGPAEEYNDLVSAVLRRPSDPKSPNGSKPST